MVDGLVNALALGAQLTCDGGEPFGHIDQKILHGGKFRLFAADTGNRAAGAAGRFLTLVTEHFVFHNRMPFFPMDDSVMNYRYLTDL